MFYQFSLHETFYNILTLQFPAVKIMYAAAASDEIVIPGKKHHQRCRAESLQLWKVKSRVRHVVWIDIAIRLKALTTSSRMSFDHNTWSLTFHSLSTVDTFFGFERNVCTSIHILRYFVHHGDKAIFVLLPLMANIWRVGRSIPFFFSFFKLVLPFWHIK